MRRSTCLYRGGDGKRGKLAHHLCEVGKTGPFPDMEIVVIREMTWDFFALNHCQAWHMWERLGMSSEVCKELALTKENSRVIGMGSVALLDAEQTAVDLFANIFGRNMALGEKAQTESDPF